MVKIGVLRDDRTAVVCGIRPDLGIGSGLQAEFPNMSRRWIGLGEGLGQCWREILVQQKLHAGIERRRRWRSAAKARHARRSS